jgi:hypothetical protein
LPLAVLRPDEAVLRPVGASVGAVGGLFLVVGVSKGDIAGPVLVGSADATVCAAVKLEKLESPEAGLRSTLPSISKVSIACSSEGAMPAEGGVGDAWFFVA